MTMKEKEIIKDRENIAYRRMRLIGRRYGRQSEEFQVQRSRWYAYYELCSVFEIDLLSNEEGDNS